MTEYKLKKAESDLEKLSKVSEERKTDDLSEHKRLIQKSNYLIKKGEGMLKKSEAYYDKLYKKFYNFGTKLKTFFLMLFKK